MTDKTVQLTSNPSDSDTPQSALEFVVGVAKDERHSDAYVGIVVRSWLDLLERLTSETPQPASNPMGISAEDVREAVAWLARNAHGMDMQKWQEVSGTLLRAAETISTLRADAERHSRPDETPVRMSASEEASLTKTLARSPRRVPTRDAEHCDFPDCEQHWTAVVAQARAALQRIHSMVGSQRELQRSEIVAVCEMFLNGAAQETPEQQLVEVPELPTGPITPELLGEWQRRCEQAGLVFVKPGEPPSPDLNNALFIGGLTTDQANHTAHARAAQILAAEVRRLSSTVRPALNGLPQHNVTGDSK